MLPLQLYSKYNLFLRIYDLLKVNNQLSENLNKSFANLLFFHAELCAVYCFREPLAIDFSNKIIELGLLPSNIGYLQSLYVKSLITIKSFKIRFLSTLSFHVFRLLLPDYLIKRNSMHFSAQLEDKNLEQLRSLL
jgi:hypothetical protein